MPGSRKQGAASGIRMLSRWTAVCLCGADPGQDAGGHGRSPRLRVCGRYRLCARLAAGAGSSGACPGTSSCCRWQIRTVFMPGPSRWCPEDGVNLNRAFPGDQKWKPWSIGWPSLWRMALYPVADFLADLHSGDCNEALHPLVFFPTAGKETVNAGRTGGGQDAVCSLSGALHCQERACTAGRCSRGIPALLIERGGQGLWSQPEVNACKADVLALMQHLGILPGGTENRKQQEIVEASYVEAEAEGFWYPLVTVNQSVRKGDSLGRLESLTGEVIQEVRAEFDGIVLYHTTALGVRAGEVLITYGHL